MGSWLVRKKLSSKQHALKMTFVSARIYLLFEQQEGVQLAFGRFCFNLLFAASKL